VLDLHFKLIACILELDYYLLILLCDISMHLLRSLIELNIVSFQLLVDYGDLRLKLRYLMALTVNLTIHLANLVISSLNLFIRQ
jgi:hypothetical protein